MSKEGSNGEVVADHLTNMSYTLQDLPLVSHFVLPIANTDFV